MKKVIGPVLAAAALSAAALPAAAPAAAPGASASLVREFEGTVSSVDRDSRTFRLRDSERGVVRVKVTRSTRFERLRGFSSLRRGLRNMEVTVRPATNGGWVAREVERSGGGGEHGGRDDD